jgi:hypothetical protein
MGNTPDFGIPEVFDGHRGPFGNYSAMPQLSWRYKVDLTMASALTPLMNNATEMERIYKMPYAHCPPVILKNRYLDNDTIKKGHGRWQHFEFDEVADGKAHHWDFGSTSIHFPLYKKPERTLSLAGIETTGGWLKRLCLVLRDCAISRQTGFYYPYECRVPLDIYLTTFGFKDTYKKRYVYKQCGLVTDKESEMSYAKDEIITNQLSLTYRQMELVDVDNTYYSTL